nr:PREDICTED: mediator of RNA polymerase II transcription subunit 9 isoform X2 [Lepisosteus oculatus]
MTRILCARLEMAEMAAVIPKQEAEDEDCSLLPLVHDIIKCMDKDSQDVHQELNKLKMKIQEAREQILAMPGISLSPEQQQQQLQNLREQEGSHESKGCVTALPAWPVWPGISSISAH